MIIESVQVGALAVNCYFIADKRQGSAIIIDPGDDSERILAVREANGFEIEAVVCTHGHWDHIGAARIIAAAVGAKVYAHENDRELMADPLENLAMIVAKAGYRAFPDATLAEGDVLTAGDVELKIVHTPGHTRGSLTLAAPNALFSGDLIFYESVGRTDLPGGDPHQLLTTIKTKIFSMPDSCVIYPGHGPRTSVGWERHHNPYLTGC